MQALAGKRVRDLVVILQGVDERVSRSVQSGRAAWFVLPVVVLALEQKAVFDRGEQLLRGAPIVPEIAVALPARRNTRAVVEIIVPHRVEPEAAGVEGMKLFGALR